MAATMPILEARDVSRVIDGQRLVDAVSLQVREGELVGLIGPNGAGKSTLLSMLAGLSTPQSGEILLEGRPIQRIRARERARTLGWLEQLGTVHWPITVERLVALGRLPHLQAWQSASDADRDIVDDALARTDCTALKDRIVTTLSGGERTRALLARALATGPRLLLADEPIAALDLSHQLQTMELLRDFAREDRACLAVLHDLSVAARWCDRLYLLHHGRVNADGAAGTVLDARHLRDVYGVEVLAGCGEVPWIVPVRRIGPGS